MSDSVLLAEVREGVLLLQLNRPDKLNGLTLALHQALREQLQRVHKEPAIRAVVLTGVGRGFCAGQDLAELKLPPAADATDVGALVHDWFNPLVRQIRDLPVPVVAAVNGVAAGAGANLALACDITLAARSANFVQAFINIGLVPDSGGTWLLPQLIGAQRAMALCMTGEKLSAAQAEQWGLIWRCVDDEVLMAEALKLAKRLARLPSDALAATKRLIQTAANQSLNQQLDAEGQAQSVAAASFDYAEGVAAFIEKRPAQFAPRGGGVA